MTAPIGPVPDTERPAAELLLAVAIFFVVQVPLSMWWLRRFDTGPMEWLWRRLTYGAWRAPRTAAAGAD